MGVQALQLRSMSSAEANARERLGVGLCLTLTQPHPATLSLRLSPAPFSTAPANGVDCACGRLWLDDAQALLSQLSSCPAIIAEPLTELPDTDWYWPLYNQYLAPELQQVLNPVRPVAAKPGPGLDCLIELKTAQGHRHLSQARIASEVLLKLLDQGQWHPLPQAPIADWPLRLPLVLGRCPLSTAQLASLRHGDVVLAEQPLFSPEGLGSLQVGACRLHLRLIPGATTRFTLIEQEDLPMNASPDTFSVDDSELSTLLTSPPEPFNQDQDQDQASADDDSAHRFDDLPLNLTLRAGHLTLSLGQLRQLGVGSVLSFVGCTPGHAQLCQGERVLANGELVNIDGRLGLQITALEALR
ncbi:type III secretion system cytoplasmic ring protein SctQ [Pseudomonas sp. NPDC086278]|uniref:type III secretion system cytoplasmic ring protein SctQ n=1 Tax=Pseudomonas sp. NPDC086278 TaxID=3390646 RepID=UPI003D0186B5